MMDPASPDRSADATAERYLRQRVDSASPGELRLMLLERGVELADLLATQWSIHGPDAARDRSLQLTDVLTELLGGVTGGRDPVEQDTCRKVADLYVFLLQHHAQAEAIGDATAASEIAAVLRVEAETWRLAVTRSVSSAGGPMPPAGGSATTAGGSATTAGGLITTANDGGSVSAGTPTAGGLDLQG